MTVVRPGASLSPGASWRAAFLALPASFSAASRTCGSRAYSAAESPRRARWVYGTTTRRSMTSVTPGAAQAVSSAVCIAAYESVVPSR